MMTRRGNLATRLERQSLHGGDTGILCVGYGHTDADPSIATNRMTLDEFKEIHNRCRIAKPKPFLLASPDQSATAQQLEKVEGELGVKLPGRLREFLTDFGGGAFGFVNVFSADPDGEFYLPARNDEAAEYLPSDLLAFSDDFAGGYYVLKVVDRRAKDSVFYWNTDGGLTETEFDDVFEFVARYAYEPA